jgi:hypothetical protein
MRFLIKLVKASAVLHNLFVDQHKVPKSWLSFDDILDPDFDNDLDKELYLSENLSCSAHSEGRWVADQDQKSRSRVASVRALQSSVRSDPPDRPDQKDV